MITPSILLAGISTENSDYSVSTFTLEISVVALCVRGFNWSAVLFCSSMAMNDAIEEHSVSCALNN